MAVFGEQGAPRDLFRRSSGPSGGYDAGVYESSVYDAGGYDADGYDAGGYDAGEDKQNDRQLAPPDRGARTG